MVCSTPVPLYFCPARRGPTAIDLGSGTHALIDYAAASGAGGEYDASGPYYGVIVRNPLSTNVYSVTDGLSNTFVISRGRLLETLRR